MAMTWREFKDDIDKQLAEHGVKGDVEIWYIDVSSPSKDHESQYPNIGISEDGELSIS